MKKDNKDIKIQANNIKIVAVKDLTPKKNNRNFHPDDQLQRLSELFKYQGFRNPLIVSNQSGEIVCGNGRYLAAIRAGLKEVPVIYQDFESKEQEYSYHVSDNSVSLWAELDLSGINQDIIELGPDFDLNMLGVRGFTLDAIVDIEEISIDDIDEQCNFIIKCEDMTKLEEIQNIFGIKGNKITASKFLEKIT